MTLVHVSGPVGLPVSIRDVKLHTRIDADVEDSLVDGYILSALEEIEQRSGVVYMPRTWRWTGDAFPASGVISLGKGPVTAVASVTYHDAADVVQTLDPAEYLMDATSAIGRVIRVGAAWPPTAARADAVSVEFMAGRGHVPLSVRHAIMVMVAQSYEDRAGEREAFGPAAQSLVGPHRRIVF